MTWPRNLPDLRSSVWNVLDKEAAPPHNSLDLKDLLLVIPQQTFRDLGGKRGS